MADTPVKQVLHIVGSWKWEPPLHSHFSKAHWQVERLSGGLESLSRHPRPAKPLHGICITDAITSMEPEDAAATLRHLYGWLAAEGVLILFAPDAERAFQAMQDPPRPIRLAKGLSPMELVYGAADMPFRHALFPLSLGRMLHGAGFRDVQIHRQTPALWGSGVREPARKQPWHDKFRVHDAAEPHLSLGLLPDDLRLPPAK